MNKKKNIFPYLVGFSALAVAFSSAFFSVFGLASLFAGAKTQVIVMAGSLEFAKLVLASFLYRYWSKVNTAMKSYMMVAVFVLMIITSGGIYGYLSSAYQDTATKYEKRGNEISTLNQQKILDSTDVSRLQERYNTLTNLRQTQETRLDTLYNRKQNNTAKRTEDLINKTNIEISQLDSSIRVKNEKVNEISSQILTINSENMSGEIGPLKYISDLTGLPMNKVVNIFILLLIFVFDPLAVTMVVGANIAFKQNEEIQTEHHEEPISKMWSFLKRKPKQQKVDVFDGGSFDNKEEIMIKSEKEKMKVSELGEYIDKFETEMKKELPEEVPENIQTMVDNQEQMPKEFVDAVNTGFWDLIDKDFEEKHKNQKFMTLDGDDFEKNDYEEILDSVENQIEENKNNSIVEETIVEETPKENIYGEDVDKQNSYTSIIQDPPPSAYTPGGGIKIK